MAACSRRLVLNGLTAEELRGGPAGAGGGDSSPDSLEFYHELELYRQLLALPPAPAPPRRARTPDPAPRASHESPARRCRTPGGARAPPAPQPPPTARPARYLGSFPVGGAAAGAGAGAEDGAGGELDTRALIHHQLRTIKEWSRPEPVVVVVSPAGVRVTHPHDQSVRMSYALRRIVLWSCEAARALVALVAREPAPPASAGPPPPPPPALYCHAFETDTPQQAAELSALVGDAFRMAFASQLPASAPHWSAEVSGEGGGPMGVRAPHSLPGISAHYPHPLPHPGNRSPSKCLLTASPGSEASPSSSSESCSPVETSSYRRLGGLGSERAALMRRLARTLLQPDDDDSTPLVADTPTTPTNMPLCMNGGYINEASEAEARTRESNRDPPVPLPPTPRRNDNMHETDDFRRCANLKNSVGSGACSLTASSSSGASSCGGGGSLGSGNNNLPRAEPELRHAPWFQHGIPREIALEVLGAQPVGAFLVRGSTTQAGCYALSVRVPRAFSPAGIAHYLILRTAKGYKIKGFTKEFRSLCALVTHHSVMPELLPVPLLLPWAGPAGAGAAGGGRGRRDLADIDAVAPPPPATLAPPVPAPPHHHLPGYLAQLDV